MPPESSRGRQLARASPGPPARAPRRRGRGARALRRRRAPAAAPRCRRPTAMARGAAAGRRGRRAPSPARGSPLGPGPIVPVHASAANSPAITRSERALAAAVRPDDRREAAGRHVQVEQPCRASIARQAPGRTRSRRTRTARPPLARDRSPQAADRFRLRHALRPSIAGQRRRGMPRIRHPAGASDRGRSRTRVDQADASEDASRSPSPIRTVTVGPVCRRASRSPGQVGPASIPAAVYSVALGLTGSRAGSLELRADRRWGLSPRPEDDGIVRLPKRATAASPVNPSRTWAGRDISTAVVIAPEMARNPSEYNCTSCRDQRSGEFGCSRIPWVIWRLIGR